MMYQPQVLEFISPTNGSFQMKAAEESKSSPSSTRIEKKLLKVVVLNDVHFPLQKLQIRFSGRILQHLEMTDHSSSNNNNSGKTFDPDTTSQPQVSNFLGMQFGLVSKIERSFRSHALHGVICEVIEFEHEKATKDLLNNFGSGSIGFCLCKAVAKFRFKIDTVLHRALEGLILTANCSIYHEQGTVEDKTLTQSEDFQVLKKMATGFLNLQIKAAQTASKSSLINGKLELINKSNSAVELTYLTSQLLTSASPLDKQNLQQILATDSLSERMKLVKSRLDKEVQEFSTKQNNRQRALSLKDQLTGRGSPLGSQENEEIQELEKKLDELKLPEETEKITKKELKKLKQLGPRNQEYHVSLNYLNTLAELPWGKFSKDRIDPAEAKNILDRDHFGLDQVKKRIIHFLAVRKLTSNSKGSILLFHGPPGVGKTSLGKSIAESLNRKFYRVALGGVRDEAEIRGHRRTYVGSMPGVIISSLKKVDTANPVFLLDEIDKMGRDARGDPAAALLEVLDPAQNTKFTDHFLGTPFDLSKVVFIATANSLETIHPALQDRMDIIDINGYSLEEKSQIAERYLIPNQIKENGLSEKLIQFENEQVKNIVEGYTAESGVRNLERCIGSICRVVAYQYAVSEDPKGFQQVQVTEEIIEEALGGQKVNVLLNERITRPGVAIGMAYTTVGGRALLIETAKFPGSGQLQLTGQLGDVMKESIGTGLSWIKANAVRLGLVRPQQLQGEIKVISELRRESAKDEIDKLLNKIDLHVHFPAAAQPKDGPSAGVTIAVALVSLFSGRRVRSDFAMTGELSLQGLVMPVGGIKEKCIAAHRNKITNVILPDQNQKDIEEIPADVKREMNFHFVKNIEDAVEKALETRRDEKFLNQDILPFMREKL